MIQRLILVLLTFAASASAQVVMSPTNLSGNVVIGVPGLPRAATPTFSPAAGTYSSAQSVTISASTGSVICYNTTGSPATNGTTGCTTGTLYTGAVSVASSETLYAVSGGTGYSDSTVGSAAYVISSGTVATPTASPAAGTFNTAQAVSFSTSTSGASIFGTLDNSTPGSSSSFTVDGPSYPSFTCTGSNLTTAAAITSAMGSLTAGQTGCIAAGSYSFSSKTFPTHSGSSGNYISLVCVTLGGCTFTWTGGSAQSFFEHFGSGPLPSNPGPSYWIYQGIKFIGTTSLEDAVAVNGAHHVQFLYDSFYNFGEACILYANSDYLTIDHSICHHSGYGVGFSSGFDIGTLAAEDSYTGFHNIIANSVSSGNFDGSSNHTDGNGYINDDNNVADTNDPATLYINDIAFGNGGRGFACDGCSNVFWVNDTSVNDGLDTNSPNSGAGNGEIQISAGNNTYIVNSLFYAYNSKDALSYINTPTGTIYCNSVQYFNGSKSGGCSSGTTSTNPNLLAPNSVASPAITNGGSAQWANALSSGNGLLTNLWIPNTSPAYNGAGVDPTTLTSIFNANEISDMTPYLGFDHNGVTRTGGTMAVGAYQYETGTLEFTGPLALDTNFTVKAIGVKSGMTNSSQLSSTYTISIP